MSSHGSEEDINFIVTGRIAENSDHELKGGCRKQNVLNSKSDAEEESLNLINSDNSGSECSSPRPIEKASPRVIQGSSFTKSSCSTSFKREEPGSGEKSDFNQPINGNGCLIEDNEGTEQFVQVSDRETGNCQRSMDEASTDGYHTQTTQHIPTTSDFTHGTKTVSDGDFCGSPSSDYAEPELAQVSASTQDNWGLKPGKDGRRTHSDSPNSDFECSSCAEDSGISSTVRDDDMEEIPLADGTISPELFQEISKLNVNDMVGSWVPKSNNTYSPNISGATGMALVDGHDRHGRNKPGSDQSSVGWKLFGKVPPKQAAVKSQTLTRGDIQRRSFENLSSSRMSKSLKKNTVANSTTALIFENRPRNLPAKSPTEERKHRQQYEAMVAQARKKELKEVKEQEKQLKKKTKQEKLIVNAASVWSSDILPNWETTKGSRKTRELWWQGIPPSVRGKVWKLAIGNDLQITHELFDIFQAHAFEKLIVTRNNKKRLKESKSVAELPTNNFIPVVSSEHKVELIMLDVSRTFPSLCIFQEGGPFHDLLHSILGAYTCYRPDVGYVQGMSFIAAVLLLNMEPPDAFICFANLLNKPCQLVFFRVDHPMMKAYFATFEILLDEFLPKIASLFVEENFSPDMYLIDWIFTLFSKSLPLDLACRVWDVFCRDGDDFLFRTALGILKYYQTDLMGMDFIHLGQFLSKLPDNISANKLFDCIASVNLNRQKFNQILTQQKELATQIKSVTASAGK